MYFKYSLNKLCGTLCVTQICNIIVDLPLLPKIEASVSLSVLLPLSVSDVVQGCVSWDHVWRSPWHWIQKEVGHKCHWDLRYWEAYGQCGRWLLLMYVAPSHVNACKLPSGTDCSVMFCSPDFSFVYREVPKAPSEPWRHHAPLLAANRKRLHHHELLYQTCRK